MIDPILLADAVEVLEVLATGQPPVEVQAMLGAFALSSLSLETEAATGLSKRVLDELAEAARGLYLIAAGRPWEIDAAGQRAAARLAGVVREFIIELPNSSSPILLLALPPPH